jgi:hypothetical protein
MRLMTLHLAFVKDLMQVIRTFSAIREDSDKHTMEYYVLLQ